MNLHIISCQIIYRELSMAAAMSKNHTVVSWMPQGLHVKPENMPAALQAEIDRVDEGSAAGKLRRPLDAIVLGYGLCSNGIVGLKARTVPLVIPRTDDCIALFLGSQKRYLDLFQKHPGTYWLNGGWIEEAELPSPEGYRQMRQEFAEQYGEENADFLMESGIGYGWTKNYSACGYIKPVGYEDPAWKSQAAEFASTYVWELFEAEGSNRLLEKLLSGDRDEEFLVCHPGQTVTASCDARKIIAQ